MRHHVIPEPLASPEIVMVYKHSDRANAEREPDKGHLLKAAEDYGPGDHYADFVGGGVRLVNKPGLDAFKEFACDIEYLWLTKLRLEASRLIQG